MKPQQRQTTKSQFKFTSCSWLGFLFCNKDGMVKTRHIKTSFWSDPYIESLQSLEKLLFLYLFTNSLVELCGIYEITINKICFDTKLTEKQVLDALRKFSQDRKILYVGGYLNVVNFQKHVNLNPSIEQGIRRSELLIPETILEQFKSILAGCTQQGTLIPILIPIPKGIAWKGKKDDLKPEEPEREDFSFIDFWDQYNKKVDRAKCQIAFERLDYNTRISIKNVLPWYISATQDVKYRKNPLTWLRGQNWLDEDVSQVFEYFWLLKPYDQEIQTEARKKLKIMENWVKWQLEEEKVRLAIYKAIIDVESIRMPQDLQIIVRNRINTYKVDKSLSSYEDAPLSEKVRIILQVKRENSKLTKSKE